MMMVRVGEPIRPECFSEDTTIRLQEWECTLCGDCFHGSPFEEDVKECPFCERDIWGRKIEVSATK